MNTKGFFKCSNCGKADFEKTTIGEILRTEGYFSVNAYACTNCGHIELFDPDYDAFAEYLREQEELKKKALQEERDRKAAEKQQKIKKLEAIVNDENSTVKQVREAQKQLNELRQIHSWDR